MQVILHHGYQTLAINRQSINVDLCLPTVHPPPHTIFYCSVPHVVEIVLVAFSFTIPSILEHLVRPELILYRPRKIWPPQPLLSFKSSV